jgi:hypothetical protein
MNPRTYFLMWVLVPAGNQDAHAGARPGIRCGTLWRNRQISPQSESHPAGLALEAVKARETGPK